MFVSYALQKYFIEFAHLFQVPLFFISDIFYTALLLYYGENIWRHHLYYISKCLFINHAGWPIGQ